MKIIYYSYYGCFSSTIAAYIHTNILYRVVDFNDFIKIPGILEVDYGELKYVGVDDAMHEIYIIGLKNFSENIKKTLEGLRKIYNLEFDKIIFINTDIYEPKYMKLIMATRNMKIFVSVANFILYVYYRHYFNNIKDFVESNKYKYI